MFPANSTSMASSWWFSLSMFPAIDAIDLRLWSFMVGFPMISPLLLDPPYHFLMIFPWKMLDSHLCGTDHQLSLVITSMGAQLEARKVQALFTSFYQLTNRDPSNGRNLFLHWDQALSGSAVNTCGANAKRQGGGWLRNPAPVGRWFISLSSHDFFCVSYLPVTNWCNKSFIHSLIYTWGIYVCPLPSMEYIYIYV